VLQQLDQRPSSSTSGAPFPAARREAAAARPEGRSLLYGVLAGEPPLGSSAKLPSRQLARYGGGSAPYAAEPPAGSNSSMSRYVHLMSEASKQPLAAASARPQTSGSRTASFATRLTAEQQRQQQQQLQQQQQHERSFPRMRPSSLQASQARNARRFAPQGSGRATDGAF
jgi:hypothetical protein